MRLTLRRKLRNWRRHAWRRGFAIPLLLIAAPAAAAPAWNATREISDAGSAPLNLAAAAGIGPTGDGVVLWNSAKGIDAVVRAAGHNFGTPRAITGSALSMPDLRPQLAFDAKGATLAIWSYFKPHPRFVEDGYAVDYTFGLRVASRSASGRFGRSQTLTDDLDANPSADVAFDPEGNAVVIWAGKFGMQAAAREVGKRRFGRAQVISGTQADPQLTVGTSGTATAAWASQAHGSWTVTATSARNGSAFGSAISLDIPGLGRSKPVIGVDARSAVTATWLDRGRVMAATCAVAGRCDRARALSPAGEKATDPRMAVAADGTTVVAWRSPDGVSAALRHGHSRFGTPSRLAVPDAGQSVTGLAVAIGPKGDAAALWLLHAASGDRVQAALRHGRRARFAKPSDLTAPLPGAHWSEPQIAIDQHGNALAVWGAMIDGHPSIEGASFDAP